MINILAATGPTTPWRTGSRPTHRSAAGRTAGRTGPTKRPPGSGSRLSRRRAATAGTAAAVVTEGPWYTGLAPTPHSASGTPKTGAGWTSPGSSPMRIRTQSWRCTKNRRAGWATRSRNCTSAVGHKHNLCSLVEIGGYRPGSVLSLRGGATCGGRVKTCLQGLRCFCLCSWLMSFCKVFGCWESVGCRKQSRSEIWTATKDAGLLVWEEMLPRSNGMRMTEKASELRKQTMGWSPRQVGLSFQRLHLACTPGRMISRM